jgi:hypothetical protein
MSNSIIPSLPAHLQKYVTESASHQNEMGVLKPSDFGINIIKVCQSQSREARPGSAGEPALPLGTMFLSRDRKVIPIGTPVIPLLRTVRYIKWNGRPGEGKMEFSTDNPNDARIKACDGLAWKQDQRTGKTLKPLVTEYCNFYVLCRECPDEPLLLSFSRTSASLGRKLTQDIIKATRGNKMPMRGLVYTLQTPRIERDAANEWYQINVVAGGFAPAEAESRANEMFELACALRDASTGAEFASIDADDGDSSPTVEAAAPANVINEPALRNVTHPAQPATPVASPSPAAASAVTPAATAGLW